jgi:hypothetical protein
MPLSDETKERAFAAITALKQVQDTYQDVLVVLDYVNITDIAKFGLDSDDGSVAEDVLSEKELRSVLWHLGKRVGGFETSADLLPALVQFAVDEHERQQSMHVPAEPKDE